jgi:ABC-type sugar transport system permease subunit
MIARRDAGIPAPAWQRHEARLGWLMVLPVVGTIALVAIFPIAWTFWESLHVDDLRMPWLGRPYIGLGNYAEAFGDRRFWSALAHTGIFVAASVTLELTAGLALALMLDRVQRGSDAMRTAILLPWAIPTVVAALIWRFVFESPGGAANAALAAVGGPSPTWFADPVLAWVPLVIADAWKTTPFVAVLLLAGLQAIDRTVLEAAAVDGAGSWRRFTGIVLPLLRPALLVAFLFRTLDAVRVFDVVYVMTGGGPGTATEPIALLTFATLMQNLRFGYGAALSVLIFLVAAGIAFVTMRAFGGDAFLDRRR